MSAPRWRVTITYREPSFEHARGWGPRLYAGEFVVTARGALDAIALAREAFASLASASGVGWSREIVMVGVEQTESRGGSDGR